MNYLNLLLFYLVFCCTILFMTSEFVDPNIEVVRNTVPGSAEYETATGSLYFNHSGIAVGALRRLIPPLCAEDIPDLVQETFIKVFDNLEGYDERKSFDGWIAVIARNSGVDLIRKRNRHPEQHLVKGIDGDPYVGPNKIDLIDNPLIEKLGTEQAILDSYEHARNMDLLSQIDPRYADAFRLRLEGFEYTEIAQILDLKVGTVKSRVHRAKRDLTKLL